jgi:hypothetical protein
MPWNEQAPLPTSFSESCSVLDRYDVVRTLSQEALHSIISTSHAAMPAMEKLYLQADARAACGSDTTKATEYVRSIVLFRLLTQDEHQPRVTA